MILFDFQVNWVGHCSFVNMTVGGIITMFYSLAVGSVKNRSEHYDAEMVLLTIILTLGVIEVLTAVTIAMTSCSINAPRQVKRNLFINFPSKHYIISYACTQENVNFLSVRIFAS